VVAEAEFGVETGGAFFYERGEVDFVGCIGGVVCGLLASRIYGVFVVGAFACYAFDFGFGEDFFAEEFLELGDLLFQVEACFV